MKKPRNTRVTAKCWAYTIEFCLENGFNIEDPESYDPELLRVMLKAQALRLAFQVLCAKHGEDFDELVKVCTEVVHRPPRASGTMTP